MNRNVLYKIAALVAVVLFAGVSISFTTIERKLIVCSRVQVSFQEKDQFITTESIEKLIQKNFKGLHGALLDTIDTNEIETIIEGDPWVKKADVFKGYSNPDSVDLTGAIKVHIRQEVPLLRVVQGSGGFYMNENGKHLPFSDNNTSMVVVVTGAVDADLEKELVGFVHYINSDVFWKAQVQQIHVRKNGELLLIPRVGDHKIEFGKIENLEKKFRNLKAVYIKGFSKSGWEKYSIISLKFENQVICTLK